MICEVHHAVEPCRFCEGIRSGLPLKRRAAEWRAARVLGLPTPEFSPAQSGSTRRFKPAAFRQVQTCLYRECGRGCLGTVCHWRKDYVGLDVCYECLKSMRGGR